MLVDLADVEIIKLTIADTMVDISVRQTGGLSTIVFMNRISTKCSFLKDSIILLKAWMTYEASLLGSHAANMATYALYVLVVFLVNNFDVRNPLEVFRLFFAYFGKFEWESQMITIYGAIKTLNFYDRLKSEFNFDIKKFALSERFK
jgi:DNA polymerase sigma